LADNIENIIKDCIEGKNSAREKLYNLYAGKMWPVCLRYSRNQDEAKDIMQEGFIKIFEKIGQYEGRGHFEGWLRRIIINTALSEYRKQHFLHSESDNMQDKNEKGVESIEANISATELLELIKELPPQYQMVFNLYAIEGYSHKEIAEMLEIAEGTSKSNLSRARDILQNKVNVYYQTYLKLG
jgi:RNA polymerase sigma-70 factor (ECF subfamily)